MSRLNRAGLDASAGRGDQPDSLLLEDAWVSSDADNCFHQAFDDQDSPPWDDHYTGTRYDNICYDEPGPDVVEPDPSQAEVDSLLGNLAEDYSPHRSYVDEDVTSGEGWEHLGPDGSVDKHVKPNAAYADPDWQSRLRVTKKGQPFKALGNIITTLEYSPQWHGGFIYDAFCDVVIAGKALPRIDKGTAITDHEVSLVAAKLLDDGVDMSSATVCEAIWAVAKLNSFHPVMNYLETLVHDGTPRLDGWLSKYMGAENSDYEIDIGQRWLISAVARIYEPGCKADCCLILEGAQGTYKSTALSILGGSWFSDAVNDVGTKDAIIKMRGKWILELPELTALNRRESSEIKAFMSTSVDRYRPVYGRCAINAPRQCVYAGTVNHNTYFHDETGQRRFWPIVTGAIDIERLRADRDQLWSEAVVCYKAGDPWHLDTPELVKEAEKRAAEKLDTHVWHEIIEMYCAHREDVSVAEILDECIKKEARHQVQADKNSVARSLVILGYERYRAALANGVRPWRYRRLAADP